MKVIILAVLVALAAGAPLEDTVDISPAGGNVDVIVNGLPEGEALEVAHLIDVVLNERSDGAVLTSDLLQPLSAAAVADAAILPEPVVLPEAVIPEPVILPEAAIPEVVIPEPVVLPGAAIPEVVEVGTLELLPADQEAGIVPAAIPELVIPGEVALPAPAVPEVVLPAPAVPEVALPAPAVPEVALPAPAVPEVVLPAPAVPEVVLPAPAVPEVVLPAPAVPEVVEPAPADTPAGGDLYNDGLVQVIVNAPEEPSILATLSSWMNLAISYVTGGVQTTNQIV